MSRFATEPDRDTDDALSLEPDDDREDFAPFPDPPSERGLTAEQFGLAVILYIMAGLSADQPCELYGLLSDRALQLAEHAARIAVSAPCIEPIAVDRISAVRMRIHAVLQVRALDAAIVTNAPAIVQPVNPSDCPGTLYEVVVDQQEPGRIVSGWPTQRLLAHMLKVHPRAQRIILRPVQSLQKEIWWFAAARTPPDDGQTVRTPERPIVPTRPSAAIHF